MTEQQTEAQNSLTFSVLTDYEAFITSVCEALLICEKGIGDDTPVTTRATLSVVTGYLTALTNEHREIIKQYHSKNGV